MSRQICQEVCPWNRPKLVRLTRDPAHLPRPSRPLRQTGRARARNGRARALLRWARARHGRIRIPALRLESDSDSGRATTGSRAAAFIPGTSGPALLDLMAMDEAAWDEFSRGSAIRRAKRASFLRNVAVALGNWGSPEAVPGLVRAFEDPERLVRGHAARALGRIGTEDARAALASRLDLEDDTLVRDEVGLALAEQG